MRTPLSQTLLACTLLLPILGCSSAGETCPPEGCKDGVGARTGAADLDAGSDEDPDARDAGAGTPADAGTRDAPTDAAPRPRADAGGCVAESDAQFCARQRFACGAARGADNCGRSRAVASCGACAAGMECGDATRPNVCLGSPDDPALDDPARASFPFECQGTVISPAEIVEHVPQGWGVVWPTNSRNWNDTARVFKTRVAKRTCTQATGCGEWTDDTLAGFNDEELYLALAVDAAGTVEIAQADVQGNVLARRKLVTGETQLDLVRTTAPASPHRYKARLTRASDGRLCVSLATRLQTQSAPAGVVHERFDIGYAFSGAPVPRTTFPPPPDLVCAASPRATDSDIRGWFTAGATRRSLAAAESRRVTRQCHPVTGCSAYQVEGLPSAVMRGLIVNGSGFAIELSQAGRTLPISAGAFGDALEGGAVTAAGCVEYRAVTARAAGAGATAEAIVEEVRQR